VTLISDWTEQDGVCRQMGWGVGAGGMGQWNGSVKVPQRCGHITYLKEKEQLNIHFFLNKDKILCTVPAKNFALVLCRKS
jgi:hypothetical protein